MAEISILLPSLRPLAASKVVAGFAQTDANTDYELVAVSPHKVQGDRVVHVPEHEKRGVVHAINEAYKNATGQYIVLWSDDAFPEKDCLKTIVDFVKSHEGLFIAGFRKRDAKGRESEQWAVYGKLYAGWLCATRKTLEAAGGLFEPAFRSFWADPDLCLRVWSRGGEVAVCPNAWMRVSQFDDKVKSENWKASFEADAKVFFDRWHDKYGNKSKRNWESINVPIPHSFSGQVRALLRKVPYLKRIRQSVSRTRRSWAGQT